MNKRQFKNIVVLTGAGISAESGLKTFREQGGLWEQFRIEDVATPEGFERNPDMVYSFYNQRRAQLKEENIKPNDGHFALQKLERAFGNNFFLVTQNVDNLHEKAGSANIHHMHGELNKARCQSCGSIYEWKDDLASASICPTCNKSHCLRPHIVWFGEIPLNMNFIEEKLKKCDLFLSIGTSGQVYPAAMFVQIARSWAHAYTIEVNLEETQNSDFFHESLLGKASIVLPKLVEELILAKI